MKFSLVVVVALAAFACAEDVNLVDVSFEASPVYGYLTKYGIPEAERIRKAEEEFLAKSRIVGGVPAVAGEVPWQAGLLISLIGFDGTAVCGGSLVSSSRAVTAAHCWSDGVNQAWRFTVVLGSTLLFSGGTRLDTSVVISHPNWSPLLARNDVAVIYLPSSVATSATIAPIALPSGAELNQDYAGVLATASGFGLTSDTGSISTNQYLSQVRLSVIANSVCSFAFPLILQESNICTSGVGGVGTCRGDSGGPLFVTSNNRPILIGVTSFGSALGCQVGLPAAYARTTSFTDFFNQHVQ